MINLVIPYNEHLLKIYIYITSRVIPNFLMNADRLILKMFKFVFLQYIYFLSTIHLLFDFFKKCIYH
jgi:hypothetical protein